MATKKFLLQHLLRTAKRKKIPSVFVYLFFCWTQLLGPLHAESPNMAPVLNRRLGAEQASLEKKTTGRILLTMAPSGHHFLVFFSDVVSSYFSCLSLLFHGPDLPSVLAVCWHEQSGGPWTALLVLLLLLLLLLNRQVKPGAGKLNQNVNNGSSREHKLIQHGCQWAPPDELPQL